MSTSNIKKNMQFMDRAATARVAPFAIYIVFLALPPALLALNGHQPAQSAFDARWLYGVQIACVAAALLWFRGEYEELRRELRASSSNETLTWVVAITSGLLVFVLWIHLDADWMTFGEAPGFNPLRPDGNMDWALVAVRLFGAAIIVPVMEELFWRSFVMRWIAAADFRAVDPARVGIKAFVISAVVFGLEHQLWFAGIVAGVAYAALYVYTRNLWLPIVAHGVTNAALGVWVVANHEWRFW